MSPGHYIVVAIVLAACSSSSSQPATPSRVEPSASHARRVKDIDWNGDGIVDLVLPEHGRACVHFGGASGLRAACDVVLPIHDLEPDDPVVMVDTRTVAVGAPATVTVAYKGEQFRGGAVTVLRAGHKMLIEAPDGAPARLGSSLVALDRDGDGKMELFAVASSLPPHPHAAVFDVSSHDPKQLWSIDWNAKILSAGDVDGDGKGDAVIVSDRVRLWSGVGDLPGTVIDGVAPDEVNVTAADLDRDGYDDLIVARLDHGPNQVWIFRGSPHGLAGTPSSVITAPDPQVTGFGWTMATADFEGHGRLDLVIGSTGDGKVRFYHPDETTPFAEWGPNTIGFPRSLFAGDFDGDGRDEIVVRSTDGQLWWFRGGEPPVLLR